MRERSEPNERFVIENENADEKDVSGQKNNIHSETTFGDAPRRWHRFWVYSGPPNEEQKSPPFIIEFNLCENNENVFRIRTLSHVVNGRKVKFKFVAYRDAMLQRAAQNTHLFPI